MVFNIQGILLRVHIEYEIQNLSKSQIKYPSLNFTLVLPQFPLEILLHKGVGLQRILLTGPPQGKPVC